MKTVFGRKNKKAVSPVIGTILMVAITVVLAAVLYVMVAGLGPGNTPQSTTMVLQGTSWSGGNFSFSVSSITSSTVDPTTLSYVIEAGGQTYYSTTANQSIVTGSTTVNVVYVDNLDAGHVSAGDSIRLTVSPATPNPLNGGSLKVFTTGNQQISTATIP